jgi:hypothetical protein
LLVPLKLLCCVGYCRIVLQLQLPLLPQLLGRQNTIPQLHLTHGQMQYECSYEHSEVLCCNCGALRRFHQAYVEFVGLPCIEYQVCLNQHDAMPSALQRDTGKFWRTFYAHSDQALECVFLVRGPDGITVAPRGVEHVFAHLHLTFLHYQYGVSEFFPHWHVVGRPGLGCILSAPTAPSSTNPETRCQIDIISQP